MIRRIWTVQELAGLLRALIPLAKSEDAKYIIWSLATSIGIPTCPERPQAQVARAEVVQ